jgi:hypothetical protein
MGPLALSEFPLVCAKCGHVTEPATLAQVRRTRQGHLTLAAL